MRTNSTFSPEQFQEPPAWLWPGYFWAINDQIHLEKLIEQLQDMYSHGARSVCLLPEPPEFRPKTMGTKLDLPYLGENYLAVIRRIVDECERLGMSYWFYDEGGWPSGGACGQVFSRNPSGFARKQVMSADFILGPDESYIVPDLVLCAAVRKTDGWEVYRPGEKIEATKTERTVRTCAVRLNSTEGRDAPYVDLAHPDAVQAFIEMTHERHKRYVGRHFGTTIHFSFTDEPAMPPTQYSPDRAVLTWGEGLAEAFSERKGYDLIPWLPYLLEPRKENEPANVTRVRVDFYDVWSQLFVERYLLPIRDWCRRNGLLSGGHFGGEDEPIYNAQGGYGHILRALRALDLPGVDAIWRQLFPDVRNHPFPKYASSAARQIGQSLVMTESYAVYGNGLTLAQMRWILNQQFARGVNLLVLSNYPYSTRGNLISGIRPHFGPANPLWEYMDLFHAWAARLGYLLSRGQVVCSTGVYYDIRSIWAGGKAQERAIRLHEQIAEKLLQAQCEFDFVDDDLLAERHGHIENGVFAVGPMRYDTIIVPATDWMEKEALRGLVRFAQHGGRVITAGGPVSSDGGAVCLDDLAREAGAETVALDMEDLASQLEPLVKLDPPCPDICVCKRVWEHGSLYFLTNESYRKVSVEILFREREQPVLCDAETGAFCAMPASIDDSGTRVRIEFAPWGSIALLFGEDIDAPPIRRLEPTGEIINLTEGWRLRFLRKVWVGQEDFESSDQPGPLVDVSLGDWREALGETFSGEAEYIVRFQCAKHQAQQPARIELGEVKYACTVILNGKMLGRRAWPPFEVDADSALQPGLNELRVRVSNTLANTLLDPEVERRWYEEKGPGWPCSGLPYDRLSRGFERESLPSGLFGPVRIVFGRTV